LAVASLILLDLAINASMPRLREREKSNCSYCGRTSLDRGLGSDFSTKLCKRMGRSHVRNWQCYRLYEALTLLFMTHGSGYINLPKYLPYLGETQFQILCVLAPAFFVVTAAITVIMVNEIDPALLFILPGQEHENEGGITGVVSVLFSFITS